MSSAAIVIGTSRVKCFIFIFGIVIVHVFTKTKSRKSYCTTPGVGIGGGGGGGGISKMLQFLCLSFLCDGLGAVRRAILSL